MNRRRFLVGAGSTATLGSMAGCLSGSEAGATAADLGTPVRGESDAPVTVAVYKDFACPHCRQFTLDIEPQLEKNYVDPGVVQYEHHDFPIPVSDWSNFVANLARAVQDKQGVDAFWAFATQAFERQADFSWGTLEALAAAQDIAADQVKSLATANKYKQVVTADQQQGANRGVTGTPTVFVNNTLIEQWSYSNIARAIDNAR